MFPPPTRAELKKGLTVYNSTPEIKRVVMYFAFLIIGQILSLSLIFCFLNHVKIAGKVYQNILRNKHPLLGINFSSFPTKDCISCDFIGINSQSDSTNQDFIAAAYSNKILGLFPFVRTFRQVNNISQIIIFLNELAENNTIKGDFIALQNCGVSFVHMGPTNLDIRGMQIIRFHFFNRFLLLYGKQFNRCIFTDGFDVFFQGDPFTTDFKPDQIYLSLENESNLFLHRSNSKAYPQEYKLIAHRPIINCGIFAGGTSPLIDFFSIYLSHFDNVFEPISFKVIGKIIRSDQEVLNYMVYVQLPQLAIQKKSNISEKIHFLTSRSPLSSMIGENRYRRRKGYKIHFVFPEFSINGYRPLLVHQYTYNKALTKTLINRCGLLPHQGNITTYYRYKK